MIPPWPKSIPLIPPMPLPKVKPDPPYPKPTTPRFVCCLLCFSDSEMAPDTASASIREQIWNKWDNSHLKRPLSATDGWKKEIIKSKLSSALLTEKTLQCYVLKYCGYVILFWKTKSAVVSYNSPLYWIKHFNTFLHCNELTNWKLQSTFIYQLILVDTHFTGGP